MANRGVQQYVFHDDGNGCFHFRPRPTHPAIAPAPNASAAKPITPRPAIRPLSSARNRDGSWSCWTAASLPGASLPGASLQGASLQAASLQAASLSGASLFSLFRLPIR
ncbi:pentapeptide repeat-containing protein [Acidithiobacillus sp. MC6.1]|nr:pentapeptide repeat-containing protein [Acidithiobacillus sp. MC6.1]